MRELKVGDTKHNKRRFPKPEVIGEIPMVKIGGEVWGFEVSVLSKEEQKSIKGENKIEQ